MKKKIIIGMSALALCVVLILLGVHWKNLSQPETTKDQGQNVKQENADGSDNSIDFEGISEEDNKEADETSNSETSGNSEDNKQPEQSDKSEQSEEKEQIEEPDQSSDEEGDWTDWY